MTYSKRHSIILTLFIARNGVRYKLTKQSRGHADIYSKMIQATTRWRNGQYSKSVSQYSTRTKCDSEMKLH